MEERLLKYFRDHEAEIFGDLERLVKAEASTSDLEALAETRKVLEALIRERTGEEPLVYEREGGHDLVRFELGQGEEKLLIIGHYDTVHLIGAIQYRTEGDRLYGPGVSDMKSGLISAIWTARAYKELGIDPGRKLAENARAALVCEPCVGNGDLKTGRKGNIKFNVTIHGKASHAGNAHKEGINAIQEMAAEILKIQALTDYEAGTTVNVGICQGGTKVNVVPAAASFSVDCRYKSMEEGQRIRREILELPISVPGASREVEIVEGKLPMEETQGNMELFVAAKECGRKLGLSFSHQFVGGGSDGNAVSAMGIPTLDGLGGWGDGAHSESEYLRISQYIPRIALLASLILDIR